MSEALVHLQPWQKNLDRREQKTHQNFSQKKTFYFHFTTIFSTSGKFFFKIVAFEMGSNVTIKLITVVFSLKNKRYLSRLEDFYTM